MRQNSSNCLVAKLQKPSSFWIACKIVHYAGLHNALLGFKKGDIPYDNLCFHCP